MRTTNQINSKSCFPAVKDSSASPNYFIGTLVENRKTQGPTKVVYSKNIHK